MKKFVTFCFSPAIPSIVRIGFGREQVGARVEGGSAGGMSMFPTQFSAGFRLLFVHSNLTALAKKYHSICAGMT